MDVKSAQRWQMVAGIAARQHGRVTLAQLRACGLGRGAVQRAVASGRLHRVHTGVFAVGHIAPSDHGRWMGAVHSCGADAALSVRSGGRLLRIHRGEGHLPDVTVPTRDGRRRADVKVHRAPLPDDEVTVRDGIRVTTVARTLVDLAHVLDADDLTRAVREAQYLRIFNLQATRRAAARRPSRALNDIIEDMVGSSSRLDDGFKRLIRRHRLPEPIAQQWLLGHPVDYVWEAQRVAVELAGWVPLRFTWADVHSRGDRTAATLSSALARPSGW